MIDFIDINCHYFACQGDGIDAFTRLLEHPKLRALMVSSVDLKLAHSADFPFMPSFFNTSNEQLARLDEALRSRKLLRWCFIDPLEDNAAAKLEIWVTQRGARGLKLYPPRGFHVDDPRALRVLKTAEELGVPAFLHMGRTAAHPQLDSAFAQPLRLEKVGLACPRLKLLIGHFASPWQREAMDVAMGFPNFYFDLSTSGAWDVPLLRKVIEYPDLGLGRLVYGSNNDGRGNLATAERLYSALKRENFSDAECAAIFLENACEVLGLEAMA